MKEDRPGQAVRHDSSADGALSPDHFFAASPALAESLFVRSRAGCWGISRDHFLCVIERHAKKLIAAGAVSTQKFEQYVAALHLEDLALAVACAEGCEAAWEYFFSCYRPYLRAAAGAILRCSARSAEACDLADTLFTDLYGLAGAPQRSLFRYFHGRSSLKTWLRAVLAQRHIDSIRAGKRFEALGEDDRSASPGAVTPAPPVADADPHRRRYLAFFARALEAALEQLLPAERERLRLYYNEDKTLAEIGRMFGEHESSASRQLDRLRRELRTRVEEILRRGIVAANGFEAQPPLSAAEISLCFEYGVEDAPIDLEKLLSRSKAHGPVRGKELP